MNNSNSPSDQPQSDAKPRQTRRRKRKTPAQLAFLRCFFKFFGTLTPTFAGRIAYKLWFGTRKHPAPKREQNWLENATSNPININGLAVMTHYWDNIEVENAPLVLLVHGWDGRGSQLGAFAEPLIKAGFKVMAYDNPAHGATPGNSSNLFIHSEVQQGLVEKIGPVHAIVAHSFGGMFTAYSLNQKLVIKKIVTISAPTDFSYLLNRFCEALRLPEKVVEHIIKSFKRDFGEDLVERISASTTSKTLGHIPALIIHDEDDIDVVISESENLHKSWPNSIFQRTQGLGHRRILHDPDVLLDVVNFIK